jgi:hypothetical protein
VVVRRALAVALLPHELAHWVVFRTIGDVSILLAPADNPTALGRLTGPLRPDAPTWVVRVGALAPTVAFVAAAALLGALVALPPGLRLPAVFLLAVQAAPSDGDLHVFLRAADVVAAGSLDSVAPRDPRATAYSTVLTLAATAAIAVALL